LNNRSLKTVCVLTALCGLAMLIGSCQKRQTSAGPYPRIISYSPAITDMLFEMGLGDHIVGVTSQCNLPAGQLRTVVGDALSARSSSEAMAAVEPDIILIQQSPENFAALKQIRPGVRIEHFDIETVADIAAALERLGTLAGNEAIGRAAKEKFLRQLDSVRARTAGLPKPATLFVLGWDRPSTGGARSFLHEMIQIAGGQDVAEKYPRWSELNAESVLAMAPEVLICWSDAGTEDRARQYWAGLSTLPAVRSGRIFVVSDRGWTIPSARIAGLADELAGMIHPELLKPTTTPATKSPASLPTSQGAGGPP
jgi:iron complex transport system substrate-binding protein